MIEKLDEAHVDLVLKTHWIGRLGCHADGKTYVVPVTYAYDDGVVYGHANDGLKVRMMRENPEVCFEVDDVSGLNSWQSVIAWGTFEELSGIEAANAIEILSQRLLGAAEGGHIKGKSAQSEQDRLAVGIRLRASKGVTYRIKLTSRTGRYERPEK